MIAYQRKALFIAIVVAVNAAVAMLYFTIGGWYWTAGVLWTLIALGNLYTLWIMAGTCYLAGGNDAWDKMHQKLVMFDV
jgi:hypothetical protein